MSLGLGLALPLLGNPTSSGAAAGTGLLMETGSSILMETGSHILLENANNSIAPGAGWLGNAGDVPPPSPSWADPTRTSAKPAIQPTAAYPMRITAGTTLGVAADAGSLAGVTGGVSSVQVYCEGATATISAPSWRTYTDVNGNTKVLYDWNIPFDFASASARFLEGSVNVYFKATPNDSSMQARVIGPYRIRLSATQYDHTYTVGASGKNFTTIKAALEASKTAGYAWPQLVLTDATAYPMNGVASTLTNPVGWATITPQNTATVTGYVTNNVFTAVSQTGTINAGDTLCGNGLQLNSAIAAFGTGGTTGTGANAGGTYALVAGSYSASAFPTQTIGSAGSPLTFTTMVTATLGDYANAFTNMKYDGLRYAGAGLKVDHARLAYQLGAIFLNPSATGTAGTGYFWLDGVDFFCGQTTASIPTGYTYGIGAGATCGGGPPQNTWVGATSGGLAVNTFNGLYVTDCFKHDMYNGILWATMVRGNTLDRTSSQALENNYCVIHNSIKQNGPYLSGMRIPQKAFSMVYSGAGSVIQFEKTGANGSAGTFNIYIDSATPTYSLSYGVGLTTATKIQDVVDWINGVTPGTAGGTVVGFTATIQDTTNFRAAAYLTMPDLAPSASIAKRTVQNGVTFQVYHIFDSHTDVFVQENAMENVIVQFNQADATTAGAYIFVDRPGNCTDVLYQNNIGQDASLLFSFGTCVASITGSVMTVTSTTCAIQSFSSAVIISGTGVTAGTQISSQATPTAGETWGGVGRYNLNKSMSATGSITVTMTIAGALTMGLNGPNTGNHTHLVIRRNTNEGDPADFASLYNIGSDLYCAFNQNAFESMSWGGTVQATQQGDRNILRLGTGTSPFTAVPSGFTNSTGLGGAATTTMYADPTNTSATLVARLKPIAAGPLQLSDGTYAGALLPTGSESDGSVWNLAS